MGTSALVTSQILADHYDGPGVWWLIVPIFWLVFFIAVFLIFARFGRWGRRCYHEEGRQFGSRAGEARLAERFAGGEIDEQEYGARLAVLREGAGPR